ncbi:hypothetical protein RHGRI_030589 [Rhododendron griersonianum]|uniref:Uncharacterized protein n=1 Tax=Rhododendron griersonianum TaxID=479676 RepID=A0AAV6IUL4_9ERIC|nr:hypothetical protein RHGRI_030589 [Rhododendron griersonianum]
MLLGAAENLMALCATNKDDVEDVESTVEDSLDVGHLPSVAENTLVDSRLPLTQLMGQKCNGPEESGLDCFQVTGELGFSQNMAQLTALKPTHMLKGLERRVEDSSLSEESSPENLNQMEDCPPQTSIVPSINLMVDLNDAGCRRRRRRQLSNLI